MSVCLITVAAVTLMPVHTAPPKTLLQRIQPWMYPEAEMGPSVMQDGGMQNAAGDRTVASVHCRTTFRTADAADAVLAHYQKLLAQRPGDQPDTSGLPADQGRAVHTITQLGGQVPVHLINVYQARVTTTLVITGGRQTQVSWSQFETFDPAPPQPDLRR